MNVTPAQRIHAKAVTSSMAALVIKIKLRSHRVDLIQQDLGTSKKRYQRISSPSLFTHMYIGKRLYKNIRSWPSTS